MKLKNIQDVTLRLLGLSGLISMASAASLEVGFQATIGSEQNDLATSEGGPYHVSVNPNNAGYAAFCADLPNSGEPAPAFQRPFAGPVEAWTWVGGGANDVLTQDVRTGGSGLISYTTESTSFDGFAQRQLQLWVTSDPGPDLLNPVTERDFQGPGYRGSLNDITATIDVSGLGSGTVYVFYGDFRGQPNLSAVLKDTNGNAPDIVIEEAHLNGDSANRAEYYCAELEFVTDGVYDEIEYIWIGNGDGGTNGRFGGTVLTGAAKPDLPFAITDISLNAETNEVTLTWSKSGAPFYVVKFSEDLNDDFVNDLDDGITADIDEDVEDDTSITVTLSLPEGLENASKLFFRVEEGS